MPFTPGEPGKPWKKQHLQCSFVVKGIGNGVKKHLSYVKVFLVLLLDIEALLSNNGPSLNSFYLQSNR